MQIIPAIDFRDGKVVNLKQGQLEQTTTYSDDPVGMADHWVSLGTKRLHLVDLDGAFAGKPVNREAIERIAKNHPQLTIQLGGGIRSPEIIEAYLTAGVDYVIIGTKAVDEPEFVGEMCKRFPDHVIVGLDGLHGMVAKNGWQEVTDISVKSLAMLFQADGIESIVYTDIGKDGMMGGVNLHATRELAKSVTVPIIASGGVTDMRDIETLVEAGRKVDGGICGVITGRALYEGTLDLAEAIDYVNNN
ncbi:MAG TPA: 1-(5-phosphoribosyl)-5-[(5-phosphoribosylamino)methylideneamino]imidazole-4-carboxamide isomerase [Pseudomonadales bacterium]|jgi:phosphoribosylformimino-5-aminoimidazole carboxamide ribotide isomerase|nr:1-(5-phosphoribosyl)-5-[(5-phosphoribosylamino)methylideneamino]imidazole-4-carboxamide isomerase [Gammaproteobacteria bacterium]MDP6025463.1 1-(5-phosphoribosyl)-5-[(5-phosphoribosylamino)methylideneamino]imidazole-4-carboxamide isomerase [Pseudomonadales bacterium]MDP6317560.1 1-(5-phosphoribosyl)-5-[(5-phosphoribosylamino)methylideneamino]imidazole-4-carboxamide isomerase [Pseudomonadales bacterium]MDP7316308.1 1-(5-phosphoribosyl)-5-[(5-phosphoribosylamino)methylideneamino]imidazole-4-car|tara:strand:- start:1105 stop:1845 length:741 start_codon:yes stop_codon:yes gene_type:complete